MPTPFMHLQIAEQIRAQAKARWGVDGRFTRLLNQEWPAFYLGHIAPDYQIICDVPRAKTHFYRLPPDPNVQAYPQMLAKFPELSDADALPPDQALFVAAYGAHLLLDLCWFREILVPYFVEVPNMGDFQQRRLVHHTLLTYLDKIALESLPETAASMLSAAQPRQWLPFAEDAQLVRWRDMVATQLEPGAAIRTVEIFAARTEMSPQEFIANLEDTAWMDTYLFNQVPVADIKAKLAAAVPRSIALITNYLKITA